MDVSGVMPLLDNDSFQIDICGVLKNPGCNQTGTPATLTGDSVAERAALLRKSAFPEL